jgi:hypothetical protein
MPDEALEKIASEEMELTEEEQDKEFENAFNGVDDDEFTDPEEAVIDDDDGETELETKTEEDEPGGDGEDGDEEEQETDPEAQQQQEQEEQEEEEDIWKDVDPKVRGAFESLEKRVLKAEKTAENATKRASGIQSAFDKAKRQLEQQDNEKKKPTKSTAKAEAVKGEFGEDIPAAITEGVENSRIDIMEEVEQKYGNSVTPEQLEGLRTSMALDAKFADMDDQALIDYDSIPDDEAKAIKDRDQPWERVIASPEFAEWFGQQDETYQALGASNKFQDVAKVLTDYNTFRSPQDDPSDTDGDDKDTEAEAAAQAAAAEKKRKQRLARSETPTDGTATGSRTKKGKEAQEEEDFLEGFKTGK